MTTVVHRWQACRVGHPNSRQPLRQAARGEAITPGVDAWMVPAPTYPGGNAATCKGYGHLAIQHGDTASGGFLPVLLWSKRWTDAGVAARSGTRVDATRQAAADANW